jgi:hypothetical protein
VMGTEIERTLRRATARGYAHARPLARAPPCPCPCPCPCPFPAHSRVHALSRSRRRKSEERLAHPRLARWRLAGPEAFRAQGLRPSRSALTRAHSRVSKRGRTQSCRRPPQACASGHASRGGNDVSLSRHAWSLAVDRSFEARMDTVEERLARPRLARWRLAGLEAFRAQTRGSP